ncbi:hypothetical protein T4D_2892, partial [Trichinella pseudospiralis]
LPKLSNGFIITPSKEFIDETTGFRIYPYKLDLVAGTLCSSFNASICLSRTLVLFCLLSGIPFSVTDEPSVEDGDVTVLSVEANHQFHLDCLN